MILPPKPQRRPLNPNFSSGPCAKPPGWSAAALDRALVGRSHRSAEGRGRLRLMLLRTRSLLELPDDYRLALVPGSDTGAFEMCLWSLLGERPVELLAWDAFGKVWMRDVVEELRLAHRIHAADYGLLPDLSKVDFSGDVVFTANGTSAGVRVPDFDFVPRDRAGLTLVDGTSAVFAMPIDWRKVDCLTFSWQKVLGGEAQHGMVVLSPQAVRRLESYRPPWPMPKVFRMTENGKLNAALFEGFTINTPSMLVVEDFLYGLDWATRVGGLRGLIARATANAHVLFQWIERTPWVRNLAVDPRTRSMTSVCLAFAEPEIAARPRAEQARLQATMERLLQEEGVAFDVGAYRDAPPGLRIWTGATVEAADLEALTPWFDWAYASAKAAG